MSLNNVIKIFTKNDFDKFVEDIDKPQNLRCKINTGYICNSNCSFCYFHSKRDSCNHKWEIIYKQLDIAKEFGVESVDFSGGEPTIHPDFVPFISYAKKKGFKTICCITNGSQFHNQLYLKACQEAGLNEVLFSLHGIEYLHEFITGVKKSFIKAFTGIINSKILKIRTRINTVVIKQNYRNLPMLAQVIRDAKPFQWNLIMYKMQYECGDPTKDIFISHEESSKKIKEAINVVKNVIPSINVRYIPFCFMKGYEEYVTNYPQKKYDPFEWSNYLLMKFEQEEEDIQNMETDFIDIDKIKLNNDCVKENRKRYKKPFKCGVCKNFLICDGFEEKYSGNIDNATPSKGRLIKNPLIYREKRNGY